MEKRTFDTKYYLKSKQSKKGKQYFSVARVTDGDTEKAKFSWDNSLVGFITKKGDIVIGKRIEHVEDSE